MWLGEILDNKETVNEVLEISTDYELMAVVSRGYPDESPAEEQIDLNELILKRMQHRYALIILSINIDYMNSYIALMHSSLSTRGLFTVVDTMNARNSSGG